MADLSAEFKEELLRHGADLVGFGDLTQLPGAVRAGLPIGVSIAVKYPKEIIRGIVDLPTQDYYDWYTQLNQQLDALAIHGAQWLQSRGCQAIAQTLGRMQWDETDFRTTLPHKTAATRAGLGWIGKSALLVTPQYGSMVRFSTILTDAPLQCAQPADQSRCGKCMICTNACPAGAITGEPWSVDVPRDVIFDAAKCGAAVKARSKEGFGREDAMICGRCIVVCPYTQRYLKSTEV